MNRWRNEQMNRWRNKQMNKWKNEQMNENGQMNERMNEQTNKWVGQSPTMDHFPDATFGSSIFLSQDPDRMRRVTSRWRTRTFDTWPCFWRSKKLVGLLLVATHLHWVVVSWICRERERERLVLKWNSQSGSECHTSLFQVCNDISSRLEPLQISITSKKKRRE